MTHCWERKTRRPGRATGSDNRLNANVRPHQRAAAREGFRSPGRAGCVCGCGKSVARKMRGQRYCSKRCRQWGSREKLAAHSSKQSPRYPYSDDATTPHKSARNFNGLPRRKKGSSLYSNAPLNILGGYRWSGAPKLDAETQRNISRCEIGGPR